ncbi:hypothetical protein OX89_04215 [Diaphorobacter sp. J5-51]|nr:hypothetical protein OX89_04215 [Diaphorobacter sp. J5-51]
MALSAAGAAMLALHKDPGLILQVPLVHTAVAVPLAPTTPLVNGREPPEVVPAAEALQKLPAPQFNADVAQDLAT